MQAHHAKVRKIGPNRNSLRRKKRVVALLVLAVLPSGVLPVGADIVPGPLNLAAASLLITNIPQGHLGEDLAVCDFNNDGYDDLAIGHPGLFDVGAVRWYLGGPDEFTALATIYLSFISVEVNEEGSFFGAALAAGDFDDDSYCDLAIGAPGKIVDGDDNAGAVYIVPGTPTGLGLDFDQAYRFSQLSLEGAVEAGDLFGASLAAGDLSGDGVDDLAIGVPSEDITSTEVPGVAQDAGAVNVVYGIVDFGLNAAGNEIVHQEIVGVTLNVNDDDRFGQAVLIADVVGSSHGDLIVGVPGEGGGGGIDAAGAVEIFEGGPGGLDVLANDEILIRQSDPLIYGEAEADTELGAALSAGDFNGDGFLDLAIGLPGETDSSTEAGSVMVLYGTNGALSTSSEQLLTELEGQRENFDRFGTELATGDLNGDGRDDLVVGAPLDNDAGAPANSGEVAAFFGTPDGLDDHPGFGVVLGTYQAFSMEELGGAQIGDLFGASLATGRFFSLSGPACLAVGAPDRTVQDELHAGTVAVLRSQALFWGDFESGGTTRWQ